MPRRKKAFVLCYLRTFADRVNYPVIGFASTFRGLKRIASNYFDSMNDYTLSLVAFKVSDGYLDSSNKLIGFWIPKGSPCWYLYGGLFDGRS